MSLSVRLGKAPRSRWSIRFLLAIAGMLLAASAGRAQIRIVAVGDSSFRGGPSMQNQADTYPARLEAALRAKGHNVTVTNAGINGEMCWQTRDRLNLAAPDGARIAVVACGGNDVVYQHASRSQAFARLKDIVGALRARGIEVLVFNLGNPGGVLSPAQVAEDTQAIQGLGAILVPPMQRGLLDRKDLHVETDWKPQTTLWHLNRAGNDIVVERTLPRVEALIARLRP